MVNSFVMTSKNAVGYRVESYRRWQERSISKELAGVRPRNCAGPVLRSTTCQAGRRRDNGVFWSHGLFQGDLLCRIPV